jgi:hypothetical protein
MFGLDVTPQNISDSIYNPVLISSYSLSIATTILSTAMIVIRIVTVSRMPGTSRQPRIAMEIIVESAILYSISALVYIPTFTDQYSASGIAYQLYADIFFAYMPVESNPSSVPTPIS